MDTIVEFKNVSKRYNSGEIVVTAVDDVSFTIKKGELVIIVGASGAGKTTILNLLGGMDSSSDGDIWVEGQNISTFSQKQLTEYRRKNIGFVFQFYNLIPNLTALENVELASQISQNPLNETQVLKEVGLEQRLSNFPSQLSGGEQQRVAIARAIAKNPDILLCDEPTGALDYKTGKSILKLLQDTCRKNNKTVVIITHNSLIEDIGDRIIRVNSGRITENIVNEFPKNIDEIEW
ncbi:ABC transporter ATP-binding protein [Streptococcus sanguinis]|uniref:ABC transporter ATP-binding protein n=1 Tax=Streptococcus sanguinis TaxID=1305 RepID=UPI000F229426|nr:ABC transporter ATP-binding protein [Streptococcus sanguinis]MCY7040021.1 ABC transporter ATP-binding protein [Streptococcus sanguinis]RKW02240.1 MAG: ABC transporter ATP-binding protein [Streptococcus sp.]